MAMAALEALQALHLKLFLPPGCADYRRLRVPRSLLTIPVQANDGPRTFLNLPLETMGSRLNLAALVTLLDRGEHAAQFFDRAQFVAHSRLDRLLNEFHSGRTAQRVHHEFEQAGFLQ